MTNNDFVTLIMVGGHPDMWGLIITFLDPDDPRSAKEQLDANYVSGWHSFKGFTWNHDEGVLTYPGDPPMRPLSSILFRDEIVVLFELDWVMVIEPDRSWEICRMD